MTTPGARGYKAERKYWKLNSGELRPTRNAAGMSITLKRSGKDPVLVKPDVLTLAVRGTLDTLGRFRGHIKTLTITRYGISERGKAKLKRVKDQAALIHAAGAEVTSNG